MPTYYNVKPIISQVNPKIPSYATYQDSVINKLSNRIKDLDLLYKYCDLLEIPIGKSPVFKHQYNGHGGKSWFQDKNKDGNPKRVQYIHVASHLLGKTPIACGTSQNTQLFRVDLDCHNEEDLDTLYQRLGDVEKALNHLPYVLIRSSGSYGLHLYYRLALTFDADCLRSLVLNRLQDVKRRWGIKVEVYCGTSQIRLPFGEKSCLLNRDTLEPIGSKYKASKLYKDLQATLASFVAEIESCTIGVEHIKDVLLEGARESDVRVGEVARLGGSGPLYGPAFWESVEASRYGVSDYGNRWDEYRRQVFFWYITQGNDRRNTIRFVRDWVECGHHRSRDFESRKRQTERSLIRNINRYLDHLDRGLAEGRLYKGNPERDVTQMPALSVLVTTARGMSDDWRSWVKEWVRPEDRTRLEDVKGDEWLFEHLLVLIGLLRYGVAYYGKLTEITLSSQAFQTICGGRRSHLKLLKAAIKLGIVGFKSQAEVGVRARIYTVHFVGRATRIKGFQFQDVLPPGGLEWFRWMEVRGTGPPGRWNDHQPSRVWQN